MLTTFPIDFLRQIFEQTLYKEHLRDNSLFGGKDQVNILSFYEQLKNQDELDRFVETYRDLVNQQNRTGLILNGVLVSPENPTYTNLYSATIIPLTFTCSLRCQLSNRDQSIITINNLIEELKGRKVDIAQLHSVDENGFKFTKPFVVGTIGENDGAPELQNGDFVGDLVSLSDIQTKVDNLQDNGLIVDYLKDYYLYCKNDNLLKVIKLSFTSGTNVIRSVTYGTESYISGRYLYLSVTLNNVYNLDKLYPYSSASVTIVGDTTETLELDNGIIYSSSIVDDNGNKTKVLLQFDLGADISEIVTNYSTFSTDDEKVALCNKNAIEINDDGTNNDILFPPEHTSFDKYKCSLSFDAIRCDEPRNLNGEEYCELSFGGSATLVSNGVQLGNDLLKISITRLGIAAESYIDFTQQQDNVTYWLEPLEMPSGSNVNTEISQLMSNKFLTNTHSDALALTLQYTFIADFENELLKKLFKYARYGTQGITKNDISPNMIFGVNEIWCSWGEYENEQYKAKIVENIDIDNTESDTLTISVQFQLQGDNN